MDFVDTIAAKQEQEQVSCMINFNQAGVAGAFSLGLNALNLKANFCRFAIFLLLVTDLI